jgi:hypothetical protein
MVTGRSLHDFIRVGQGYGCIKWYMNFFYQIENSFPTADVAPKLQGESAGISTNSYRWVDVC